MLNLIDCLIDNLIGNFKDVFIVLLSFSESLATKCLSLNEP